MMTRSVFNRWKLASCVALGTLLGGVAGCVGNDSDLPDVPRAGPILTTATHRIAESEEFVAFAEGARLDETQRILVARTLALHLKNEESIQMTAEGLEQVHSLRRQLLGDTVAHLRAQIPEPSWDAFTRSGLLPGAESVGANDGRSR